jgi:hypothetical protein
MAYPAEPSPAGISLILSVIFESLELDYRVGTAACPTAAVIRAPRCLLLHCKTAIGTQLSRKIMPAVNPPLPELPREASIAGNQKGPMNPHSLLIRLKKTPMEALCSTWQSIAYVTSTVVTIWLPTAAMAIPTCWLVSNHLHRRAWDGIRLV